MKLLQYWLNGRVLEKEFTDLSKEVEEIRTQHEALGSSDHLDPQPLPDMEEIKLKNSDFFAWLYVEGTNIDYPVMFTPESPEYYLRRNFKKQYSIAGTPFLDSRFTDGAENYIIYGHNMKNGSMFANLLKYRDETFFKSYSRIRLTTLYEEIIYEVIAVFLSEVHVDRNTFPWFNYLKFQDENVFLEFVSKLQEESLLPLPVTPIYGDSFLTLVTCSNHDITGRFVLIARKVR
ncbi:class B sortase [Serpentinicella alkaliphila]|nr:class B sortase [Serpentinicella alkaliphila]QUH27129.1 class B sortase [Serpentinicella alkaliphila]